MSACNDGCRRVRQQRQSPDTGLVFRLSSSFLLFLFRLFRELETKVACNVGKEKENPLCHSDGAPVPPASRCRASQTSEHFFLVPLFPCPHTALSLHTAHNFTPPYTPSGHVQNSVHEQLHTTSATPRWGGLQYRLSHSHQECHTVCHMACSHHLRTVEYARLLWLDRNHFFLPGGLSRPYSRDKIKLQKNNGPRIISPDRLASSTVILVAFYCLH